MLGSEVGGRAEQIKAGKFRVGGISRLSAQAPEIKPPPRSHEIKVPVCNPVLRSCRF